MIFSKRIRYLLSTKMKVTRLMGKNKKEKMLTLKFQFENFSYSFRPSFKKSMPLFRMFSIKPITLSSICRKICAMVFTSWVTFAYYLTIYNKL